MHDATKCSRELLDEMQVAPVIVVFEEARPAVVAVPDHVHGDIGEAQAGARSIADNANLPLH